ncbi:MAG: hypothetical protein PHX07_04340 [Candidatus Marinimicrobia bacterium]|nr:hypothetical protein [Candidatus Neomarinimicrobiota bacterium]
MDEFSVRNQIDLSRGEIDAEMATLQYKYIIGESPLSVALNSMPNAPLDVKSSLLGRDKGYMYDGYWMTGQSVGNRLAGKNAALLGMPLSLTMFTAGTLHVIDNGTFKHYGAGYFGETEYAGRQIENGYRSISK